MNQSTLAEARLAELQSEMKDDNASSEADWYTLAEYPEQDPPAAVSRNERAAA